MTEEVDFFAEEVVDEKSADYLRTRISSYVKDARRLALEIEDKENEIKILKAQVDELELRKIPDALLEAGLSKITTFEGLEVSTKLFVGAIPKDKKEQVFSWMDTHGHSSLIKRNVSVAFDKGSSEAAKKAEQAILELGLTPKTSLDVHHMTWSSFAKEQTNKGVALPFEEWGVYVGQRATIKG